MAATRVKTSGRKKTAAKAKARKKTSGKAAAAKKKTVSRKKTASKKTATRKPVGKKAVAKKAAGRKAAAKKSTARKKTAVRRKTIARTTAARKPTAKKSTIARAPGQQQSQVEQIAPYKVKRGEAYMNEDQRRHFHDLLLAWKRDLMEEADRTVHHMQDEASNFPDPNDRASQESEFSLELRTRDRERKLLRKIDKTLKRVETDDYGWCDACGAEIGVRRLEARPTATLCFDCKTLDEIRERQKGI